MILGKAFSRHIQVDGIQNKHTLLMHKHQSDFMNESQCMSNACLLKNYSWKFKYPQKVGTYFTLLAAEILLAAGRHVLWFIRVIFKEHVSICPKVYQFSTWRSQWLQSSEVFSVVAHPMGRIWHGLSCIFRMSSYRVVLRFLKYGLYISPLIKIGNPRVFIGLCICNA